MFTGIVEHLGSVTEFRVVDFGVRLVIDAGAWSHRALSGESIAVNGCFLTVAALAGPPDDPGAILGFDVIRQTLDVTTLGDLTAGGRVNLEHAVTPTTMLGGHIVQGHVDGVAVVAAATKDETEWRLRIEPPAGLMEAIVDKGSVALDGVSLTVAASDETGFEVALIPTTLKVTTLGLVDVGSRMNIETDYVAKTVVNWLERRGVAT